jgi:Neuraminidase (sialidase)
MAYIDYDDNQPVPSGATLGTVMTNTRNNLRAMRDACLAMAGGFVGWDWDSYDSNDATPPVLTPDQPAYLIWSKGTLRVKAVLTWGTTGGEAGQVTRIVYSYSADSGSTWDVLKGGSINGYYDFTYNTDGVPTSGAWS